MAISKILHIGDCGAGYAGKHLKQALDYIAAPEKTGDGQRVGFLNCRPERVYEQMERTKERFGKTDKRQGYHIIISFPEGEADARTAFEIIGRFAESYLGKDYEAMYAVHDNTDHVHGHVIFNSVSFRDGKKYRYKKGDWEKKIQPVTDRLCAEYGLQTLEMARDRGQAAKSRGERNARQDRKRVPDGRRVLTDMIRRDIDTAILGEDYTEERIRERIPLERISSCGKTGERREPRIVYCRVKRQKRAGLSGIQKRYFARLYRAGLLKKRPYSKAWQYRDDIREMEKLKEDYLFLVKNHITTVGGVRQAAFKAADERKEAIKEKGRILRARARMKPLFDMADGLAELEAGENCFRRGEPLFGEEHEKYVELSEALEKEGYTAGQILELKEYYRGEAARIRETVKAAVKEEKIALRVLSQIEAKETAKRAEQKRETEKRREGEERQEAEEKQGKQEERTGGGRETGRPHGR